MGNPWVCISLYYDQGLSPEWAHVHTEGYNETWKADRVEVGGFEDSTELLLKALKKAAEQYIELGVWK
jgi:hypothetical protein